MKIRDYSHVGIQIQRRKSTTELVAGDGSRQVVPAAGGALFLTDGMLQHLQALFLNLGQEVN